MLVDPFPATVNVSLASCHIPDHEAKVRQDENLVGRAKCNEIASVGVKSFFSPTVTKWLHHSEHNVGDMAERCEYLKDMNLIWPVGSEISPENGRPLTVEEDPGLYQAAWYE